jgi:hypothetical protein
MQVCPALQKRLDAVWDRLQTMVAEHYTHDGRCVASQIEIDTICVEMIEEGAWPPLD